MKSLLSAAVMSAFLFTGQVAKAVDFNVSITNLTNGIFFTPFLVAAHPAGMNLFIGGQPASASLQAMAEGGDISLLMADLTAAGATIAANPAGGLLAPGMSTNVDMNTFAGLNSINIPMAAGTYEFLLPAFDAGTEANDELITGGGAPGVSGIPADPGALTGTGGTGAATTDANTTVHIHRNTLGDTDPTGGISDLVSRVHRWLNPVIRVVVTVN